MDILTRILGWLHTLSLNLYPQDFRAEFGDEMQAVFAETMANQSGVEAAITFFLRELRDLPIVLWQTHIENWFEGENMSAQNELISPSTKWHAFIGALPFLAFGVSSMISNVDHLDNIRGYDIEMIVYAISLIGLLIGWIRGFPLWSYSYLGWSLLFALLNTNLRVYAVDWGYRVWIPFGVTVLIAILWTRSLTPIKKLLHDIWNDWTRLSLVMFAFVGFVSLIYDENHHPYLLLFMLASTLAVAGGAWFFLRSSSLKGRVFSIVGGFIAAAIVGGICWATWDWHAYNGYPKPDEAWYETLGMLIIWTAFCLAILFWPVIIDISHRIIQKRQVA